MDNRDELNVVESNRVVGREGVDFDAFNWGAFWLTWLWGYRHDVLIGLLGLVPVVNLFVMYYLGKNGNRLAYEKKQWQRIQDFQNVQKRWEVAGWIIAPFFVAFYLLVIYNYYYIGQEEEYIVSESLQMIQGNEEAMALIGGQVEIVDYFRGSPFFFIDTTYSLAVEARLGKYWAAVRLDDNNEIDEILLSHWFVVEGFREVIIRKE